MSWQTQVNPKLLDLHVLSHRPQGWTSARLKPGLRSSLGCFPQLVLPRAGPSEVMCPVQKR